MKIIFKKDVSVSHSVACLYISSGILVFLGEPVFICNRPILKIYLAKSMLVCSQDCNKYIEILINYPNQIIYHNIQHKDRQRASFAPVALVNDHC